MAGIITNVDSDVQKLRKLKNEIEEVKKALKGINIKVDVDIAKGMEAQLKSLTDQYDALFTKVAEAEGKILLSTKRINDASEKIIKAQENLSKITGVTAQPVSQNVPSSNASETASIQLQAKAYDELRDEIDSIIGTRSQNIKRMIEESNAIRFINAEIKKITKSQGESSTLSSAQQRRLEQLNSSLLTHKTALAEVRQNLSNNVKMDNAAATSMNGLSQSLSRMRMTYRELTEEERKSPFGKELLASINQADAQIKELDATIGNHQRNVGNYGKQWNGLSMSIQQVGRELPSLAYGPKVFFSAISNNLPILADEIKRARTEYDLLKKSGQSATPVWKQIISSLFSWQTALTVGITLLTLYGDKIVKWMGSLGKTKDATLNLLSAEQELALARKSAWSSIAKEQSQLDILYKKLKDVTLSTTERNAAVNAWINNYKTHSDILDGEKVSIDKLKHSYAELSKEIYNKAIADKYADKAADLAVRIADEQLKVNVQKKDVLTEQENLKKAEKAYEEAQKRYGNSDVPQEQQALERYRTAVTITNNRLNKQLEIQANLKKNVSDLTDTYNTFIGQVSKLQTFNAPTEGTYDYWQQQVQIADTSLKQIKEEYLKVLKSGNKEKIKLIPHDVKNQYDKAIALKTRAEKALSVYDTSSKQDSEAEKQRKKQEKSAEELLSLRRQNQQDEINLMKEGSEKKLKQIELDYQKELDAIKKQERAWSKEQNGKLTQEQSVEISTRYTNAENKKDKSTADLTKEQLKEEQQALNDYLKNYGTFQQQKLAIAQEYAEKIKKAQEENNGAQVKLLEKQRDVAIQNKETEAIKANIDWVTVFGEFGGMFNDMIRPALEEAKKYVKTDEFKNSDQASQNALIDAISQMEKSLGGAGGLNFKKLGQDVQIYQNSLQRLNMAKLEEADAIEKLKKAQEDYEKALKSGTEEEKQAAQDARDIAQQNADTASSNVKAQTDIANGNQQGLTDTASNLRANMENVTEGLSKLASGGVKNAYDGLMKIGKGAGGAMEKLADKLDKVPIIGWIISIIDVFKDGLSDFVGTLLDSIFNAVSGILSDVLSGDFFVTLGKSLRDGIGSILNSITFGGWNSWMDKISGSNAKEVQEAIDRLTSRNETLEKSIDRLSDIMDKTAGSKSISAYKQAFQYQQEQNANTLQIAREQARYRGGHHSWQKYMSWDEEQLRWARNNVDQNFSGTDSLWNLTPEQMRMLLSNADIYNQIKSAGKGGYGDRVMEKLEAYADNAEKLDELTEKINESLMQVSFDSLRDSFLDSLMDMDKDAKDFSNDFSEYLQRALLNFSMGEMFDDELKGWYNEIAELMKKQGGKLTQQQIEEAKAKYDKIVEKGINERDKIAEITGYSGDSDKSQSSTSKGFQAMSQDTGEELNGRFTALQIAGEEIKNQSILQTQSLNLLTMKADTILSVNTDTRNIADEIRSIQINSYLELQEIRENTGAIVKPIQQMQKDIAEVKKNTSKL